VKINFLQLPENQFQLELNSFVSNFELAQQTFLAGEIRLALLRSPCFSLPLLPLFLLSITYSAEENPSISIFPPLSLFLPFPHFLSHPLLLTPPFCPSSLSYSFLLPSCFQLLPLFLLSPLSFPYSFRKGKVGSNIPSILGAISYRGRSGHGSYERIDEL